MVERELLIDTADGRMDTFLAYPDEECSYPVVLFYMDAPGIRGELFGMARRIAAEGYFVVLPNLYYREVRASSKSYAETPLAGRAAYARFIDNHRVMRDTAAMLAYADHHPQADANSIAALGYCMSGAFVFAAAGTYPERIRCAASVYGVNLVTDGSDSPHLLAAEVTGELYFACAEHDEWVPGDVIPRLEACLAEAAVNYRIEWYPGTHHGFAFTDRADAYDRDSAERLWVRLFDLFERNLAPAAGS